MLRLVPLHAQLALQWDIPRRATEEERNPPSQWPENRTEEDEVDFYPEEDLPKANVPRRGKDYIKHYFPQLSDGSSDSDDCQILIPIAATPIRFSLGSVPAAPRQATGKAAAPTPPVASSSTDTGRGKSRGQKDGVAKADLSRETKRSKVVKVRPKRTRPTFKG